MENDLIINYTPTGMIPTKDMTTHVPLSVQEIVEDVHEAHELGITLVHIHARDQNTQKPTYHADTYADIVAGIRKYAPKLIICVSLSGRDFSEFEKRSEVLNLEGKLKPDMGSLTLSSLNFNQTASLNDPEMIQRLALTMLHKGIVPEFEAFDAGMINYLNYLKKKKLVEAPFYINLLLGNIACAQPDLLHAGVMLNDLPDQCYWSLAGIGNAQLPMNTLAIAMGGGVRVGLEDNIYYDKNRNIKPRNIELLRRVHRIAAEHDRAAMYPDEFRKKLRMLPGDGEYGRG